MPSAHEVFHEIGFFASVGAEFAESAALSVTLNTICDKTIARLDAEAASIFLLNGEGSHLVCEACAGPLNISGLAVPFGEGIVSRVVQGNRLEVVRDVEADPAFAKFVDARTGFVTRSILCAPLVVKGRPIGAIEVINKRGGAGLFSSQDEQLLAALAPLAALAIHNARMAEALVEQEVLKHDLQVAGEIQRRLLPDPLPDVPIHGVNRPAKDVSGDFYAWRQLPDGRLYFSLGDVSGKGMQASLLMAKTLSLFQCLAKTLHQPGRLLAALNDEIVETRSHGMFVTMVAGLYDPQRREILLSNAGHLPPLYRLPDGRFLAPAADAPPLGILDGMAFPEQRLDAVGGSLYLYSDGVTEGGQKDGAPLGEDGFKALLAEMAALPLAARLENLTARIAGHGRLHDDVTLLGLDA